MSKNFVIKEIADLNTESITSKDNYKFINYLDTSNLTKNKIEKTQYLKANFPSRAKRKVRNNTILYSTVRPSQEHYGIIENIKISNLIVSTGFTTIDTNSPEIVPKYLYYKLTQPLITNYLHKIAENSVSAYPSIKPEDIGNLKFNFPDYSSQKRVANVLSSLDAKIELNNLINTELEAMAKTLYDYWFVQFDFPNADGKPYKSSGGKMVWNEQLKREIPEGWKVGNLLMLSDLEGGGTPSKTNNEYWNGNIPFYTPTDYTNSVFTTTTQAFITRDGLDNCSSKLFRKGTIIITARGTVGNVTIASTETAMNQSCYALCPKSDIDCGFLYFNVKSLISILKAKSGGSVFNSIVSNDIKQAKLAIPPTSIVLKYANISNAIFEKILTSTKENQHLSSLRDWLLPMLMNGQVAVGEKANSSDDLKTSDELTTKNIYRQNEELRIAAETVPDYKKNTFKPSKREAFLRKLMLASHIVYELCEEPTFGHTKLMKLLYLSEQVGKMALQTHYKKFAAGPFDGKTLTLIDLEYEKNRWFTLEKRCYTVCGQQREATIYKKTEKSLCYKKHFNNYFEQESGSINKLISLFRSEKTKTAEIVATLYFAWKELLAKKTIISEDALIKVFYEFHQEKKRFTKEQILAGYHFMLKHDIYPELG
jgi:type I restriction enzyme S subunit